MRKVLRLPEARDYGRLMTRPFWCQPIAIALFTATLMAPSLAFADECLEAIPPETAEQLFHGLVNAPSPDGCKVNEVKTDRSQMTIVWTRGGANLEAVVVTPKACMKTPTFTGNVLAANVPPSVKLACDGAVGTLANLLAGGSLPGVVKVEAPGARRIRRAWAWAAGSVGLVAALGLASYIYKRRRRRSVA
jgi:hypothetical protein